MSKGKAIAAALVLAGLLVFVLLDRTARDELPTSARRGEAPGAAAELPPPKDPLVPAKDAVPETIAATAPGTAATPAPLAPPRSHVFGRVTDRRDAPLAGMSLHIASVGELWADPAVYPDIPENQWYSTTTDADGRFSFDLPVPSSSWISLTLEPPPYFVRDGRDFGTAGGRQRDPLHVGDNDLGSFRLADAGAFEGYVRDASGAPLRAVLYVEGIDPNGLTIHGLSDELGHFVVGGVPAGTVSASAECDGCKTGKRAGIVVQAGQTTPAVDFTLQRAAVIAGRVVDESGAPLAGVDVQAWSESGGQGAFANSAGDGRFELSLAEDGSYRFDIEQPGYDKLDGGEPVQPGTRDVVLVLHRRAKLSLRIVDAASGAPIAQARAELIGDESAVEANADGRIELATHQDRDQILVRAEGYVPRGVMPGTPAPDGSADIHLEADGSYVIPLVRGIGATGRVVQDGAPVAHAVLRVDADELPPSPDQKLDDNDFNDEDPTSDVEWPAGNERTVVAGEDGRFHVGELSPGHWRLAVSSEKAAPRKVSFVVAAAHDVDLGDVTLTGGGAVEGHVALAAGRSAEGLLVGLDTGPYVDADFGAVRTLDVGGAFRFDLLAPGSHQLFVGAVAGVVRPGDGWPVTVTEGGVATVVLDLAARSPHRLEVLVRVNGTPTAGLHLGLVGDHVSARPDPNLQITGGTLAMAGDKETRMGPTPNRLCDTDASGLSVTETDAQDHAQIVVFGGGVSGPLASVDVALRAGESSHHEIDVVAGWLHVRGSRAVLGLSGSHLLHVERDGEDFLGGYGVAALRLADDLYDLGAIRPGHYHVVTFGSDGPIKCAAEVVAGQVTEVSFAPAPSGG